MISGHFGCVYKGYLTLPNEKAETIVACKTLHSKYTYNRQVIVFVRIDLLTKEPFYFYFKQHKNSKKRRPINVIEHVIT
jgi:hypothetical protein